jgi:hypothetical protein
MEKLRRDLKAVSKRLSNLVQQLEKIIIKVDEQIQFSKIPKVKSTRKKAVKTVPEKKAVVRKTAPASASDKIFQIIKKSKKGINTKDLIKKTGYDKKSVSNAIYKLIKQGKIKTVAKGVYVKTKF